MSHDTSNFLGGNSTLRGIANIIAGYDGSSAFNVIDVDSDGSAQTRNLIWNSSTLAWEKATGSLAGGGTVTVNNFPATQPISAASLPLPSGAATEASLIKIPGLSIPIHDYIALTYTGDNLTGVVYKTGGSGGTTVATLTLAYTGAVLNSVTKT